MNYSPLAVSIYHCLVYFDLFDFPLTAQEVWRFLWRAPAGVTIEDCVRELESLTGGPASALESADGFYFLPGRSVLVKKRQEKIIPTEHWLVRAREAAALIRHVPFLKAILVCNSVGAELATEQSDIDFLVITSPGKTWLVRFWCNSILRLFNRRTYGEETAGRICLSFFVDTYHLDFGRYRIAKDDIHFAYWLFRMIPILDKENWQARFLRANRWTKEYIRYSYEAVLSETLPPQAAGSRVKQVLEYCLGGSAGDWLQTRLKNWQMRKLKPSVKQLARENNKQVILGDGILKFHERDSRAYWRQRWLERISNKS